MGLWNFLIILEPDLVISLSINKAICAQQQTKKNTVLRMLQRKKNHYFILRIVLYQGNPYQEKLLYV